MSDLPDEIPMTWKQFLITVPGYVYFIEWVIQRFGPLPDGNIQRKDYERFKEAYDKELGTE